MIKYEEDYYKFPKAYKLFQKFLKYRNCIIEESSSYLPYSDISITSKHSDVISQIISFFEMFDIYWGIMPIEVSSSSKLYELRFNFTSIHTDSDEFLLRSKGLFLALELLETKLQILEDTHQLENFLDLHYEFSELHNIILTAKESLLENTDEITDVNNFFNEENYYDDDFNEIDVDEPEYNIFNEPKKKRKKK